MSVAVVTKNSLVASQRLHLQFTRVLSSEHFTSHFPDISFLLTSVTRSCDLIHQKTKRSRNEPFFHSGCLLLSEKVLHCKIMNGEEGKENFSFSSTARRAACFCLLRSPPFTFLLPPIYHAPSSKNSSSVKGNKKAMVFSVPFFFFSHSPFFFFFPCLPQHLKKIHCFMS